MEDVGSPARLPAAPPWPSCWMSGVLGGAGGGLPGSAPWALSRPPGLGLQAAGRPSPPPHLRVKLGPRQGGLEGSGLWRCSGFGPCPRAQHPQLGAQVLDEGDSLEGLGLGADLGSPPALGAVMSRQREGLLRGWERGSGSVRAKRPGAMSWWMGRPWLTCRCLLCRLAAMGPSGELRGGPCRWPWHRTWQPWSGPGSRARAGPGPTGPAGW